MSMLSLRLPESVHAKARELAQRDNVSLNQFITIAVAEKVSALLTADYFNERANRASREAYQRILDRVPDVPPDPGDEIADSGEPPSPPHSQRHPRKRQN